MDSIAEVVETEGHIQHYKLVPALQEEHNTAVLFHSNHVVIADYYC